MIRPRSSVFFVLGLAAAACSSAEPHGPMIDSGFSSGDASDSAMPDQSCSGTGAPDAGASDVDTSDAGTSDGGAVDAGAADFDTSSCQPSTVMRFCDLPGSIRYTVNGVSVVPGGSNTDRISFLHVPPGFCVHYFGNVANPRQLRFAPGGELFVATPSRGTTSGGTTQTPGIMIMPDDDRDGVADTTLTFLGGSDFTATQGILFSNDGRSFYYQQDTKIFQIPYESGQRTATEATTPIADITVYSPPARIHWPKSLDQADDGTIYVSNGGEQDDSCDEGHPFKGGILKLDSTPGGTQVAKGFRNPIAVRCERGKNLCFAAELALDYSAGSGGREKLVPIRQGDDWGFPCCYTTGHPTNPSIDPAPGCATVTSESVAFTIGGTPFGFDFDLGKWPSPYTGSVFVTLHGAAGSWAGARVVAIAIDPSTGLPLPGDDLSGMSAGAMSDFATGWDDGMRAHGRPTALTFAPDGRMFLSDDQHGDIVWIAPLELAR